MDDLPARYRGVIADLARMWSTGRAPSSLRFLINCLDDGETGARGVQSFLDVVYMELDKYGRRCYPEPSAQAFEWHLTERVARLVANARADASQQRAHSEWRAAREAEERAIPVPSHWPDWLARAYRDAVKASGEDAARRGYVGNRTTNCWNCGHALTSRIDPECPKCRTLVCSCGACLRKCFVPWL